MTAFSNMTSARIYEEIMEVSDEICNAWEIEFMESIGTRLRGGICITHSQRLILEKIYDKACKSDY